MNRPVVSRACQAMAALCVAAIAGCASESHEALQVEKPVTASTPHAGPKSAIAVGKFDNGSGYMRGLFSDGVDRLGSQARTILVGHLQETGRFNVMDRDNLEETAFEARIAGKPQALRAADVAITGNVVEFGRKETGDRELFGIFGSGKQQVAYSKVTLNVVDVTTSQVLYSVSGAGQYALSNREIIGFGSTAAYDSTLNGKVLDLAIREAVDRLAEGLDKGGWAPLRPVQ